MFDMAVTGLAKQGFKQSLNSTGRRCVYRGKDNMKCAIGHCLEDNEIVFQYGIEEPILTNLFAINKFNVDARFVSDLQMPTIAILSHQI